MKSWVITITLLGCMHLSAQIPPHILFTESEMQSYVRWKGDTLLMYDHPQQDAVGQPEFILFPVEHKQWKYWLKTLPLDSLVKLYTRKSRLPVVISTPQADEVRSPHSGTGHLLSGWRIAIDPGHMAGDPVFAREVEGKYMKMDSSQATYHQAIEFYESELTLATALILKDSLEKLGATVLLTRTQCGKASHGLSFEEWKATAFTDSLNREVRSGEMSFAQAIWWRQRANDGQIFKSWFNRSDLHHRIGMIREFRPDLTLVIHYNVDLTNWEQRQENGSFLPGMNNYSMAFVPGAFMNGELAQVEDRIMMLRLLLTDDYAASVRLSSAFIQASQRYTGVPPVSQTSGLRYLQVASRFVGEEGVYARNLSLTRNISGPVCYGESLCQDARWEAIRLNQRDLEVGSLHVSSRVAEVAQAYLEAVKQFVFE